ncbi:P-loop containing nucleoside triphosphate hydrolase protein [Phakopsora pachyrhizi]|nr:P-loop containing nucleoside triphosphate hydrolase protein [Phakopsora pachyrhizi]KAI8447497.1 P-loop containing nucleoside triphosphate hydrolase protein [Phakopsora pachyrhizi]
MASSISVAVRVRPPTERERNLLSPEQSSPVGVYGDNCLTSTPTSVATHRPLRSIIRVLDQRVLIFDPPESNPLHHAQRQILARLGGGRKVKDMRFCFDRVFDETASQEEVYEGSARELISGVLDGLNATVFAYGATGCGKTHTITGTPDAPGIVYLLMRDLFERIANTADETTAEISISYLEIYNETIKDLLNPSSPVLNLREANSSVSVPGLTTMTPQSASDVISLISSGNSHRTVHGTEANAVSSRSHAVLSVNIRSKPKTAALTDDWAVATLSVIDLAGSERAAVTRNKGDRLLEGANINKSLLALGNCINALCDPKTRNGHVPYRNSKLTRLLKHSLGGNCRTLMIVCVAPTSAHYDETHNTLQYANRAKEIKTKARQPVCTSNIPASTGIGGAQE